MDINKLLKNVNSVDEYINVTQEVTEKFKNTKVQFNITTVLALKKIRSLEVEYLNKCYENGAACIIFERLLALPPSKTWGVLAKELVSLLQYWLEAIRKYLLTHSQHWWSFLKLILKFIKEIRLKDLTIPNILVEQTAECLLDIATRDSPDAYQRHDILHGMNIFCAESSREIRFAMRIKLGEYFTSLAVVLAQCGYLPCQYVCLEALVRWLVPRQDTELRAAVAKRWFPPDLYPSASTEVFLSTSWTNFFQDARDFLNPLNEANGLVTSVVCRRLTVGNNVIISGAEKQQTWLDINSTGKSISVLLDPRVLETFGVLDHRACETLLISEDNTEVARLQSESSAVVVSVQSYLPPLVQPAGIAVGGARDVTIVISTRTRLDTLDTALKAVFGQKYHSLMNLDSVVSLSPQRSRGSRKHINSSEEDTRFSHPSEVKRRPHSGYVVRSKHARGLVSPSTASTSSLAQLHDKLEALPKFKYDKEPVSICAQPQLSSVTEISELDDKSIHSASTLKIRHYMCGISDRNFKLSREEPTNLVKKKADSDSETLKPKPRLRRQLSPVVSEDNTTSCLLVATIGSTSDSVINDTLERLANSKQLHSDNIVDLLVQEALDAKPRVAESIVRDSAKNISDEQTVENEVQRETIENTPIENYPLKTSKNKRFSTKKICKVISKSTTDDESNTETVNETPCFVNVINETVQNIVTAPVESKTEEKVGFDVQVIEEFFSQHITENKRGEILISPTLASKVNRSSSDTSENIVDDFLSLNESLNANEERFDFDNFEIVECLNDIVDKVCSDFEKFTDFFHDEHLTFRQTNIKKATDNIKQLSHDSGNESKPKKNLKLTPKAKMEKNISKKDNLKKTKIPMKRKTAKKMSTILELKAVEQITENANIEDANVNSKDEETTTPLRKKIDTPSIKKKRKLYSPKDDEIEKENKIAPEEEDDDVVLSEFKTNKIKTPKSVATCYKELEKERKHIRLPRSRKPRSKILKEELPSPRTLKMDTVFNNLKSTVQSNEKIVLVNNKTAHSTIYNFTSDSEDEDFVKTIENKKRANSTKVENMASSIKMTTRKGRQKKRPLYSENSLSGEVMKAKPKRRKKAVKKNYKKNEDSVDIETHIDLVDERMRKAGSDNLDYSIVIEQPEASKMAEDEFKLHVPPKMEIIPNDPENSVPKNKLNRKINKTESISIQKENDKLQLVSDKEEDKTVSPLPGLVVETIRTVNENANDSLSATLLQKMREICEDNPDANNESFSTQNMLAFDIEDPKDGLKHVTKRKKNAQLQNEVRHDGFNINNGNTTLDKGINENTKSMSSIETNGITAHGDLDEVPPGPELVVKSMQPREMVDLNESLKNYFVKLNRELSDPNIKTSTEKANINKVENSAHRKSFAKSPVVQIQRLPYDDITKLLLQTPKAVESKKNNTSSSKMAKSENAYKEPISNFKQTGGQENEQLKHHITASPKSPIVPIVPLSLEEFDKWLPMPKSLTSNNNEPSTSKKMSKQRSIRLVYNTRQNSKTLKDINIPSIQKDRATKQLTPKTLTSEKADSKISKKYTSTPEQNSDVDSDIVHAVGRNQIKLRSTAKKITNKITKNPIQSDTDNEAASIGISQSNTKKLSQGNKTVISPIKDFEDFVAERQNHTESEDNRQQKKSKLRTRYGVHSKDVDKYVNLNTIPQSKNSHSPTSVNTRNTRSRTTRNSSRNKLIKRQNSTSTNTKEIIRLDSSSTNIQEIVHENTILMNVDEPIKSPIKRKSSPLFRVSKKMRVETDVETTTIESERSVSSVKDWLRNIEPSNNSALDTKLTYKDTLKNIMEKLDITVDEINQNTSKKFVNLFVDAQKQLVAQQVERRNMYKTVATEIITQMVSTINEKFTEMDNKSQEMDSLFKEKLKNGSLELIREDYKQKRALVTILKEDVKEVLDHIERTRSELS